MVKWALVVWLILALPFACSAIDADKGGNTAQGSGQGSVRKDTGRAGGRSFDDWRVMPIRSEQEFDEGRIGGEAEQHPHGIARSPSNPDIIYVSHDVGQVWKSEDAGRTWRKTLGVGMWVIAGQSIEVDPVNPDIVFVIMDAAYNYLAEDYEGVYRSTDGGETWELVLQTTGRPQRMYQHNLAYDPASVTTSGATCWYAALPDNGLYRSDDGGKTWRQVASLAGHENVYSVQTHPTDGSTVYLASSKGLFVSTDRGANLTPSGDLPPGSVSSVAVNPQGPNVIHAVLEGKGLYRSLDAGVTFSLLKEYDALHVFLNPRHPNVMFLSGARSISIASHDGGATWQGIVAVPAAGLGRQYKRRLRRQHTGFVPNPNDPNEAVAFSVATLWRSTDGGLTFADSATGFTGYAWGWWADSVAFDVADPNRFAFFCADVGIVITENGGQWFERGAKMRSWYDQGLISWTGMYAGDIQPIPGSEVIVGSVGRYWNTKLVRSSDGGRNWQMVDPDTENHLFVAFHPEDPNLVFSGRKRSFDTGQTWQTIDYLAGHNASILGMCRARPDTIYAMGLPRNRILRSDDRGDTWRVYAHVNWTFRRLDGKPTFAVHPEDPDKVYTLDRNGDLAVFDGSRWTSLSVLPLAGGAHVRNFVRMVAIDPRHPDVIYAETQAAGLPYIFRSPDAGKTWEDITCNLPRRGGGGIVVHPLTGDLLHGSPFGTWVFAPPYESPNSVYRKLIRNP